MLDGEVAETMLEMIVANGILLRAVWCVGSCGGGLHKHLIKLRLRPQGCYLVPWSLSAHLLSVLSSSSSERPQLTLPGVPEERCWRTKWSQPSSE